MAQRHEPVTAWVAVASVIIALAAGFLPVALAAAPTVALFDAYLMRVVWFTLLQAGLSTLLSIAFAIPVALSLSRHHFRGKAIISWLFGLPLALPAIVAILGIVDVFGKTGWLGGWFNLYGLTGILIAHVFFNMPMAARFLLQRLESTPAETQRLGQSLGFDKRARFRFIERPLVTSALPAIASLIFLLCTASFAVVLTLGGGPQATTLEVAIYQSLRFDYDPARAASFAIVQFALCTVLVWAATRYPNSLDVWPRLRNKRPTFQGLLSFQATATLAAAACFVALPIVTLLIAGLHATWTSTLLVPAIITSVAIACTSALIALVLAWALAQGVVHSRFPRLLGLGALATLIIPPAVLATGWFILSVKAGVQSHIGPALVVALNALMALPFAVSALAPAIKENGAQNDRLCASLGLKGWQRFHLIDLPALARPTSLALALCLIVSLGDLTAITLFGSNELVTLPSLIHSQMGAYRLNEAAGTALVLLLLAGGLIFVAERRAQ